MGSEVRVDVVSPHLHVLQKISCDPEGVLVEPWMPISTKSGRRASAWAIASGPEVTVDDCMAHAGESGAEVKGNNTLILDNESARWPLHRPAPQPMAWMLSCPALGHR